MTVRTDNLQQKHPQMTTINPSFINTLQNLLPLPTLALAFSILLFSSPLEATETRMQALGGMTGVTDESDVFKYPGLVPLQSFALIELGGINHGGAHGGGVYSPMGLGLFLSRDQSVFTRTAPMTASAVQEYLTSSIGTDEAQYRHPENPIDLFWGTSLGKKSAFGVRVTFADFIDKQSFENNPADVYQRSSQQLSTQLGYSMTGASQIDFGLGIDLIAKLKASSGEGASESSRDYQRKMHLQPSFRNIVKTKTGSFSYGLEGLYSQLSAKLEAGTTSESMKLKETGLSASIGQIFALPEDAGNLSGQMRLSFLNSEAPTYTAAGQDSFLTSDDKRKVSAYSLDATLAFEYDLLSYMGVMASMNPLIYGRMVDDNKIPTDKPKSTTTLTAADQSLFAFGIYSEAGSFRLDAVYSSSLFYNGPNFLTGNTSASFITRIGVAYLF
jgi:hypothetical protein